MEELEDLHWQSKVEMQEAWKLSFCYNQRRRSYCLISNGLLLRKRMDSTAPVSFTLCVAFGQQSDTDCSSVSCPSCPMLRLHITVLDLEL